MTRYRHEEALRRALHEAMAQTFTKPGATPRGARRDAARSVKEDLENAFAGADYADLEARVYAHAGFRSEGGRSEHPLRAVGYQLRPGGPLVPLLDGKTGGPVAFSKADMLAASYGQNNEAFRVLRAMERFDDIKIVR